MVDSLVHRLIDHCDVKQVMAETNETNLGSIKVLERNGFFLLRERGEEPNTLKFQRNLVSV
jgi:RimJ/RimL family protein N-acetyltransferase